MGERNSKILIVDDTMSSSVMLKNILYKVGFNQVDIAKNKKEAFKLTAKKSYEIIFMDYHLNDDLNGVSLLKILKLKGFIHEHTSCIMMSNDNTKNAVLNTINSGINSFIFKPYQKGTIEERVLAAQKDHQDYKEILQKINKNKKEGILFFLKNIEEKKYSNNLKMLILGKIISFEDNELIELIKNSPLSNLPMFIFYNLKTAKNKDEAWLSELRNFAVENKLLIDPKEYLLDQEIKNNNIKEAELLMKELIVTMPSNTELLIKISSYAIKINNKKILFSIGNLIFQYVQRFGKDWLSNISLYLYNVSKYIEKNKLDFKRNLNLIEKFKNRIKISKFSISIKKDLIRHIDGIIAKLYLRSNKKMIGKKILLDSIKNDENKLEEIPTETLMLYLSLTSEIRETKLFISLYQEYKTRTYFSLYSRIKKQEMINREAVKNIINLENELNKTRQLLKDKKYEEALIGYRKLKEKNPHSSEVTLGLINSLILNNEDVQSNEIKFYYLSIQEMNLFELQHWHDSIIHPAIKNSLVKES
jgi:DNA-binding response OmpR family regulator/metal-responsive CopG/Arc/MetJ family transcriptional regulator